MVRASCCALLLLSWAAQAGANEDQTERELKSVQSSILKLQEQLQQDRNTENSLYSEIQELERGLTLLKARQKKIHIELEDLKVEKMQLGGWLHKLQGEQKKSLDDISVLVLANHVFAEQDGLGLLLKDADPTQTGQNLQIYRYFIQAYEKKLETIREQERLVHKTFQVIQEKKHGIDRILEKIGSNRSELVKAEASRSLRLEQTRSALRHNADKVAQYQRREQEIHLLLKVIREETRQRNIAKARNKPDPAKNASASKAVVPSGKHGFSRNKGNLALPVKSRILNRFGQKRDESGQAWKGIMFQGSEGDPVTAVYRGQVVFSDWFGSFGQLIILEHGDGYMSLYGHNQQLYASIGTVVETGQLIASVGDTGGLENPALYFEIRYDGIPDDPLKWCRL